MGVFDVPQKNAFIFNKYIEMDAEEKDDSIEIDICKELPELKNPRSGDDYGGGARYGSRN
jgi:hypothetical protein